MITHTTRPTVPEEVIRLAEDAQALRQAIALLKTVDPRNVSEDTKDMVFFYVQKLKAWEGYARRKLATEYLDPRRTKIERNRNQRH